MSQPGKLVEGGGSIPPTQHNISSIPQFDGNISLESESDQNNQFETPRNIPVVVSDPTNNQSWWYENCQAQPQSQPNFKNLKVIRRSNKCIQALDLPTVINLNPRSVYNKQNEFHTLVSELSIDLICISESWERENQTLDQIIQLEDYQVISNVHQRTGKGGRPAIIANEEKYFVQNITNSLVQIPHGVEIVWAILTPKKMSSSSLVKKIAVASIYSKPSSKKKSVLLDHIAETYHLLCSKYQSGLHFIMAGDTNDLKLDSILSLSPQLVQVVRTPTRKSAILDPIITTLAKYYQSPVCLPPLDADPDQTGAPSDHMIVFMEPINTISNNPARIKKTVKFRPLPQSGITMMGEWIVHHNWETLYSANTAHQKAELLQNTLMEKLNLYLPEKVVTYTSDDQVWVTPELKQLARKKSRDYFKHRKSPKWKTLSAL